MAPEERILLNTVVFALGGQEPVHGIKVAAALITAVPILEETVKVPAAPGHIHQVSPPITNAQKAMQRVRQPTVPTRMPMRPTTMRPELRGGRNGDKTMPVYGYEDRIYTISELRFLFPNISFPAFPSEAALAALGVTLVPDAEPMPEELLAAARADRLVRLGDAFEHVQRFGHFGSSVGFEVDANERANRDVGGLVTMLEATGEKETLFCDYGNSMRRVTLEQLKRLQLELIAYGRMLYARKWELREAVNAARTPEDVAAIEINFDDLPAPVVTVAA